MNYNPNFYCPITGDVMSDPVIDRDGITYERAAIEEWIQRRGTSPTTRAPMALTGNNVKFSESFILENMC